MTNPGLRAKYLADTVATASPARLLVMLYDRLVLDLAQAEEALRAGDRDTASERLLHAQEIVMELRVTLRMDVWEGAQGLAELYGFLITQMVKANVGQDADIAASCRALVEPLRDAWRQAALTMADQSASPAA
jgi:flagellar secretion chaperone FliS